MSLRELAGLLGYAQERLAATATQIPICRNLRGAMQRFEVPYDVPTEIWEVLTETSVALEELIDRLWAAASVTDETLQQEFPELREAANAGATHSPGQTAMEVV